MTTRIIAWVPFSTGFQSMPLRCIARAIMPSPGWNMKMKSTLATAGATA